MFKKRRGPTEALPKHVHEDDPHQQALDDTIEASFPASDPPSTIPDPVPDLEHTGERKEPRDLDS